MCVDSVCVWVMGGEEEEEEEEEEARVTRALLHFSRMLDKAAKNRFHLIAKKLIPTPTTTQSRAEQRRPIADLNGQVYRHTALSFLPAFVRAWNEQLTSTNIFTKNTFVCFPQAPSRSCAASKRDPSQTLSGDKETRCVPLPKREKIPVL